MLVVSRRDVLKSSAATVVAMRALAAQVATLKAKPLGIPIGSMTFNHRARINCGDFAGLLKDMNAIGIEQIELCDPFSYAGFQSLADGKTTRKILDDADIKAVSCHVQMPVYRERHRDILNWAHDVGITQLSTADLGPTTKDGRSRLDNNLTTEDFIKEAANEYNGIARVSKSAGISQVLHGEWAMAYFNLSRTVDGRNTYPLLIEHLDPALVGLQFQMSAMPNVGSAITYFTLYPGRFWSAHLQGVDAGSGLRPPIPVSLPDKNAPAGPPFGGRGRGMLEPCSGTPGSSPVPSEGGRGGRAAGAGGGSAALALGEDTVDWPRVFEAAKIGGLRNYFIEMPWEQTVKSVAYLKTLT